MALEVQFTLRDCQYPLLTCELGVGGYSSTATGPKDCQADACEETGL